MTVHEQVARYAPQISSFLDSEASAAVFEELDRLYYAEFKLATTDHARLTAWAKSQALDDLKRGLRAIVDAAAFEEHAAQKRAKTATA